MEREKQIEEICEIICKTNGYIHSSDYFLVDAEAIYKAGYRKVEQGEWLTDKYGMDRSVCSICKATYEGDVGNYCPNCGAYMKGE